MNKKSRAIVDMWGASTYAQIYAADPTPRKSYFPWLEDRFLNKELRLEDLPKATAYLTVFHRYKNNLSKRKITDYKNLPALFTAIEPFMPNPFATAANGTTEQVGSRRDVIELYNKKDLSVVVPLSMKASDACAQGTELCTAYHMPGTERSRTVDKPLNRFWDYAAAGPLLMVSACEREMVEGQEKAATRRYLLHFARGEFRDEKNAEIDLAGLIKRHPPLLPVLRPYMQAAVQRDRATLFHLPAVLHGEVASFPQHIPSLSPPLLPGEVPLWKLPIDQRDEPTCLKFVQRYGWSLRYVPHDLRNKAICITAVQGSGMALDAVPEKHRDRTIELAAVNQDAAALGCIPEERRDKTICRIAVQKSASALGNVPEKDRNRTICRMAIETAIRTARESGEYIKLDFVKHIPNKWQDRMIKRAGLRFDSIGYLQSPEEAKMSPQPVSRPTLGVRIRRWLPSWPSAHL